jgi:hypothetical protein
MFIYFHSALNCLCTFFNGKNVYIFYTDKKVVSDLYKF